MTGPQPPYADCPLARGQTKNPTAAQTTFGITEREATMLGRTYWETGPDGGMRAVKIMKNVTGSTLTKRQVVKNVTSAGRFGLDATLATDDTDPVCGVVEEFYSGGVPDGHWFRCVVQGKISLYLQTTSSSRCTIANGGVIVAGNDDGTFFGQNSSAANAAVQNRLGRVLQATTNTTDNGNLIPCEVNIAW